MAGNHRSGRKPKPDALRVLEGGRPAHAPVEVTAGLPDPPDLVAQDAVALRYWKTYGAHLVQVGVMAHEYGEALATLSCVSADYERARGQFAQAHFQSFHVSRTGAEVRVVETPILRRLESLALLKTRLLGEFGLTPTMASKVVQAAKPRELSKWERLTQPRAQAQG